jgi:hypothetical protein
MKHVETDIGRLVAAGCRRPVIYFCLEELSPVAVAIRAGRRRVSVPRKDGEYDLLPEREREPRPRPAREDLEEVRAKTDAARRVIHRYRRELELVADACERHASATAWERLSAEKNKLPDAGKSEGAEAERSEHPEAGISEYRLPRGIWTSPKDGGDALALLMDSLTWASSLAEAYWAPYETTLLKSKGLLYLTAYVGEHADARKFRGRTRELMDNALGGLATRVTDKHWSPSNLRDKLDKFKKHYPRLHKLLVKKLDELHRFHAAR